MRALPHVAGLGALLSVLVLLVLGSAVGPAFAQGGQEVPVYVVRSAAQNGGVADTLPEIAQRTLGDPNLATEIFELNDGRAQADGGALTTINQSLDPGWILILPSDASGPFVQFAQEKSGSSSSAAPTGSAGERSSGSTSTTASRLRLDSQSIAVVLAVLGGLILLGVTLFILLRRRDEQIPAVNGAGRGRSKAKDSSRRRRWDRSTRETLTRQWRADPRGLVLARAALSEAGALTPQGMSRPVAAELLADAVRVIPSPSMAPAQPWWTDSSDVWTRSATEGSLPQQVDAMCRPVRIGGSTDEQTFVDISHCDGAIALTGDESVAGEFLTAMIQEMAAWHPDIAITIFGQSPQPTQVARLRHSGELAALIGPPAPAFDSPLTAAAQRRRITGLVVVPSGTPEHEAVEVVRLCSTRGSTWLAVVVGDVSSAHWRFDMDGGGNVQVPILDRTMLVPL